MRIDSSGRLLINKTTNRDKYFNGTYTGRLQVEGTDDTTRLTQLVHNSNSASQHIFVLGKSRGGVGSYTSVADGDFLGTISFQGADGDEMVDGARIEAQVNGTPGNDAMPTDLLFKTNTGGASPTERMRIAENGNIGIGTTSPDRIIHCHNSSNTTNVRAKFSNGTTGEGASDGFEIGINGSDPAQAVLVNYENSPMAFFTNGSERMRIGSSGRLFVGTTSTSLGSSGVFGEFCLRGGTEGAGIHLADNDANVHGGLFTSDISNAMFIRTITNHPMVFRTNNTERMRIHSSGIVTMTSTPAFQAKGLSNAASSSATTNANEFLVFSTVNLNQGGDYDNSNGRFTAPVDGMYFFTCMMLVDNSANTDANYLFSLTKNGSTSTFIRLGYDFRVSGRNGEYGPHMSGSGAVSLDANDYVQVYNHVAGMHTGGEAVFTGFLIG
jgi:hypothetical protein